MRTRAKKGNAGRNATMQTASAEADIAQTRDKFWSVLSSRKIRPIAMPWRIEISAGSGWIPRRSTIVRKWQPARAMAKPLARRQQCTRQGQKQTHAFADAFNRVAKSGKQR